MTHDERDLVTRALSEDEDAERLLVRRVSMAVRARILCMTRGRAGPSGAEVEDLINEVWCRLLENDAHRLRAWDPSRGKTLEGYVSLIATQWVATSADASNRQKRAPAGGLAPLEAAGEVPEVAPDPEETLAETQSLSALWAHLEAALPERGRLVLRLVYVDDLAPAEAARHLGVQPQVVYNWQHRIRSLANEYLEKKPPADAVTPRET